MEVIGQLAKTTTTAQTFLWDTLTLHAGRWGYRALLGLGHSHDSRFVMLVIPRLTTKTRLQYGHSDVRRRFQFAGPQTHSNEKTDVSRIRAPVTATPRMLLTQWLSVVDAFTRECLALETDTSMPVSGDQQIAGHHQPARRASASGGA